MSYQLSTSWWVGQSVTYTFSFSLSVSVSGTFAEHSQTYLFHKRNDQELSNWPKNPICLHTYSPCSRGPRPFRPPPLWPRCWEEEQGLFKFVHSPPVWLEQQYEVDHEHYSIYYDLLFWSSSIMNDLFLKTTANCWPSPMENAQYWKGLAPSPSPQPYRRESKRPCSSTVRPYVPCTRVLGGGARLFPSMQ